MALIDKIGTIALSSLAVAGASAYYSYSTSIKEAKKVDKPKAKKIIVNWPKAKGKGYEDCIGGTNPKPKSVCGWLYSGLWK